MQPERLPTNNPHPSPPRLTLVATDTDVHSLQSRTRRSNRILAWSVLASLGVNALFVVLLSHADLFGQARSVDAVNHIRVQVYKPLISKPTTKQSVLPKIKAARVSQERPVATPPPVWRPTPPAPTPITPPPAQRHVPTHLTRPTPPVHAPTSAASHISTPTPVQHTTRTASARPLPAASTQLLLGSTVPSSGLPAAPRDSAPSAAEITAALPTVTASAKHDAPSPAKHNDAPPQVKHEEPKRPSNWVDVEVQQAAVKSVPDPDTDGIDASEVKGSCVVLFDVGENGRVFNVRVKKSSGNSDFDRACQAAMRRAHCVPAIQDHIPQVQPMIYSFNP